MPTVLKKFTAFQVESAVLVPRNAGAARLARIRREAHRHNFDYTPRRGFLYVRSRAISSRTNDNYDSFPAEEIKAAYKTFIGKPCFVNHVNDNHKRARGVIIDAALHEDRLADGSPDTWAEVLMEIDAINFPKLAEAILKKRIDRTSMGCDVAYSICSMCGNKATTPAEYCSHIPRLKGKKVLKRNAATGAQEEHLIRETCYGLKFFENSLLVEEPADPTAFFTGVDDSGLKVAASKVASEGWDEDLPTEPVGGHSISMADCEKQGHGPWNLHDQCLNCGYTHESEAERTPCTDPWCVENEPEHSEAEHMDPPHLDPYHPDHQSAERGVDDAIGNHPDAWLLDHQPQGPTKYSLLKHFAHQVCEACGGDHPTDTHGERDSDFAECGYCGVPTTIHSTNDCPDAPHPSGDVLFQHMMNPQGPTKYSVRIPGKTDPYDYSECVSYLTNPTHCLWHDTDHLDTDGEPRTDVNGENKPHDYKVDVPECDLCDGYHSTDSHYDAEMNPEHHEDESVLDGIPLDDPEAGKDQGPAGGAGLGGPGYRYVNSWDRENWDKKHGSLVQHFAASYPGSPEYRPGDRVWNPIQGHQGQVTQVHPSPTPYTSHEVSVQWDHGPSERTSEQGVEHSPLAPPEQKARAGQSYRDLDHANQALGDAAGESSWLFDQQPTGPTKQSSLDKTADWYYNRSQVNGEPIVHAAGQPLKDGRPGLDVGDHVLFPSGHSARIHAITPSLLLLEGHGPMHRAPIEGDHSKAIWDSSVTDEAGQDVPEADETSKAFLDSNPTGPTKYSSREGQGQWRGPEHPDLYDHDWKTCGHNNESLRDDGLVGCDDCGAVSLDQGSRLAEEWGQGLDGSRLDDQGQGPTKYSLLQHFASSLCPDCGGEELYNGEHAEHPHLHGTTAVSPDSVHLWQDHHGLTNVPMKWRTPSEHPLWDHFHTEDLAWHPENPANATEDWRTDPGPEDHLEDTFTPLRQSLNVTQHFADTGDWRGNRLTQGDPSKIRPQFNQDQSWREHLMNDHGYSAEQMKGLTDGEFQRARQGETSVPSGKDNLHGVVEFLEAPFKREHDHLHAGDPTKYADHGHTHPMLDRLADPQIDRSRWGGPADPLRGGTVDPQNPNVGDFRGLEGHPTIPNLKRGQDPRDKDTWSNISGCPHTFDISSEDRSEYIDGAHKAQDAWRDGKITREHFESLGHTCPDCGAFKYLHANPYSFDPDRLKNTAPLTPLRQSMNVVQHFASLWPQHPLYQAGDKVVHTTPNGNQYPATVHSVDEPDSPDHPGTVWVTEDGERADRGPTGMHPKNLSPHPEAPAEQLAWHEQQKAKNAAGEPYVPERERDIDISDRTTVRHLTDQHDFTLDTERRPHNNTTMGGSLSPRLFVGDPMTWANHPDYGYRRPYVAEIDVPKGTLRNAGGYSGENEIHARHFDKANVTRVLPYTEYEREQDEPGYHSPVDTRTWTPEQHTEHLKAWREHLHENHNWGWNEFDENHNHVGLGDEDWDEKMPDPRHGYPGTYVRRDRKGEPMHNVRSSLAQHFASESPDDNPVNHLFKGNPGQEDCHCGWGEDWHPHLTTGPGVTCTTCGHDYKTHALHDPSRYEHLKERESRPPMDSKQVMRDLFSGPLASDYDNGTREMIDGAFRNPASAEQWLNKGTQGPTKYSLLQVLAGMHGVPLFDVGDKVINFRGDETGVVQHVQDSGHPGKSNKVSVAVDGSENPPEGHPDHVRWQAPGEKYVSHNYEDVWKPHPEAPPEQHAKYHQRKADNKAATDLLSSIEAEHGEDFDWLNDQRLSSKQASGFGDGDADAWKTCDQGHRHWGTEGAAGLLIRHRSDDGTTRYLLQHRSPWVDDGDTWGIPAGALHKGETPRQGAQRESVEELGGIPHGLRHIHTHTDDHGGWAFHTLVMESPSMWGSSGGEDAKHEVGKGGTGWYTAEQMKDMKLHPGFKKTWDSTLSKQAARLTLIQGGKPEEECRCDDSDVYDGYAECPVHPHGSKTSAKQVGQRNVWPTRVKIKSRDTGKYTGTHVGGRGLEERGGWPFRVCEDHLAQLRGDIARHNVEETGHPHTYEVETDTWPLDPTSTKNISACDACTIGSVNQAFAAGHKKRHRTRHHHHRHPQSHPMYKGRWFGGWGHLHGGYPGLGYCCNVPGCLGDDAGTVDSTGATGMDSAGTDGGAGGGDGGGDGGGSATASRRTATNDFFDSHHWGPKEVAARPDPAEMSDEQLHHHLSVDHEYGDEGVAYNLEMTEPGRRGMDSLHNWSHQVSNYALDPNHRGKPMEAGDVPHHHGEDWRPGPSNSFGVSWQSGDLTHMDTGNRVQTRQASIEDPCPECGKPQDHIHLDQRTQDFYRAMYEDGQRRDEMHRHNEGRVVNLADPTDLKAHMIEAHYYEPETDFWRTSHDPDHPALDHQGYDDEDRPLHPHEVRRLHDWEHGHGIKNEDPDYDGGMPGTFMGDSHFHTASKGVDRHDREHPIAGVCPHCGGITQGEGDALHCLDCYWQPGDDDGSHTAKLDPAVPKPDKERFAGVTLSQDDDGYYVRTHRARSDSYDTPEKIPDSKIEFIRSTGAVGEKCTACSGTGEQGTGHECYICDGSGQRSAELEGRAAGVDNANPENRLLVGRDDSIGQMPRQAAAGDTTAGGLTRHDVPAEQVQEGDYLDISGKVRVHKTMQRGDTVTLAWRQRGSKAPGIRQHQTGETVKVWRRGTTKDASFEPNPILDNDWAEYDNGFAHGKAGQSPVSDSKAYLMGHRRGLDEDGRKQASRDESGGIDEDPGEYPAHYSDGFDRHTYWGPQEVWDRFHELSAQNIRYGPSDGRVTEQHHLQTHLGNPDWVQGHQGQEHQPGPVQQGDVGGGKPWGSDCPFCGADASKVTQGHRGGISPAGVEHYQCADCQGWMSKRAHKTATWIGDHFDEPTLFWRAPKSKKWEVHIDNHMPDRSLRDGYGAKPSQGVILYHADHIAPPHPNAPAGSPPRGGWRIERNSDGEMRFNPTPWGNVVGHVPPHVMQQVHNAFGEVDKHAADHENLYGGLAQQQDIRDDMAKAQRDHEDTRPGGWFDDLMRKARGDDDDEHTAARRHASMPGGFLTEFSDTDDRWSKPEGKAPYDPLKVHHGLDEKEDGHGPWYVTRHPETYKYQVVDAKNRLVSTHSTVGHPSYEIHDPQAEHQAYHRATQANQDHGHIPKWHDRDGNEVEDTGIPRWGGNGERIPGTEHARRHGEPVEDGNSIDSQHVQFHYPAPPWEHGTEHPKVTEYKQRAVDNPAPKVLPPKIVQASASREHGSTYRRATPEEYDSPGAFHDPSPEDEWHGPYRVIQHAQTGKFHVADNQDRITQYGGREGMDEQHTAELMRDYADGRQASKERAKGLAESLWGGAMEALDPGGTDESRRSESNMRSMSDLMHRYEGGEHHPLHAGKFGYDEDDEDNGQPYYEVTDPGGSGWKARDYGGSSVRIHHAATGDTEHDIYSFDDRNNSKPEGFGHDELHQTLHKFVHGDPDDSEPYAPAPDFAEATPEIKRWQKRNGYHHG